MTTNDLGQETKKSYSTPELRSYGTLVEQTRMQPTVPNSINEPGKVTPPQGDNPEKKTAST